MSVFLASDCIKCLDGRKMEPSVALKIQSEQRHVISSNFLKSFRGAGDLMVLGECLKVGKKNRKIFS